MRCRALSNSHQRVPQQLTTLGEFGSDLLGCIGGDPLDVVGRAQRMKSGLARSFGMQDLTSRNFTSCGILPYFDLLKNYFKQER